MDPRESFVFYRSFYEAISGLPVEQHDRILSAIIEYAIYGTEMELSGIEKMAFTLAKPSLDSSRRNYENGKNGGRPKKNQDGKSIVKSQKKTEEKSPVILGENHGFFSEETEEKNSVSVSVSVSDSDSDAENENESHLPHTPKGGHKTEKKKSLVEIPTQSETEFSDRMQESFEDWLNYKKERKEMYKATGLKTLLKKLKTSVEQYGEEAVVDMLTRTIAAGYQGPVWDWLTKSKQEPKEKPKKDYGWDGFYHSDMDDLFPLPKCFTDDK